MILVMPVCPDTGYQYIKICCDDHDACTWDGFEGCYYEEFECTEMIYVLKMVAVLKKMFQVMIMMHVLLITGWSNQFCSINF